MQKEQFISSKNRLGGFYELSIQVCPSLEDGPIKLYSDYVWNMNIVQGPFNKEFELIEIGIENFINEGAIKLGNYELLFVTHNIREEFPIETGYNWFNISFYTSAIENTFGSDYKTWIANPKVPIEISNFFENTIKDLHRIYPFMMAMVDFEVSGIHYFEDLKNPLTGVWTCGKYYVSKKHSSMISKENIHLIRYVEDI